MNELAIVADSDDQRADEEQFVTMLIDGQTFGIPILNVQDIVEARQITPVPLAPSAIAGVMNLRGRIVTVIDLRRCLGLVEELDEEQSMGVTVEYRNDLYTLLVDSIGDVRHLHRRDFEKAPPTLKEGLRKVSTGVYRMERDLLVVLDVEKVLDAEQLVKTPPVVLKPRKKEADGKLKKLAVSIQSTDEEVVEIEADEEVKALERPKERPALAKREEKVEKPKSRYGLDADAENVVSLSGPDTNSAAPTSGPLFERIGGDAAVEAAVDIFYGKLMRDPDIKPFFRDVDMDKQSFMMRLFLTGVFGGVKAYNGPSLRDAHKSLVEDKGLSGVHFDKVAGHLSTTLDELSVPSNIAQEVMTLVASTRKDVLNQ
jgi:chemotaxis signal transduction protein/truncated hemoglobin YjbI